jgi:hypothetical protein
LWRSEIIQHRNGDKESNNYRRRDTLRCTRKCIQGEECTTMAVYDILLIIKTNFSMIDTISYYSACMFRLILSYRELVILLKATTSTSTKSPRPSKHTLINTHIFSYLVFFFCLVQVPYGMCVFVWLEVQHQLNAMWKLSRMWVQKKVRMHNNMVGVITAKPHFHFLILLQFVVKVWWLVNLNVCYVNEFYLHL